MYIISQAEPRAAEPKAMIANIDNAANNQLCVYISVYMYRYMCMCVYIYIYIYIEREGVYTYIYIYI